MRNIVFTYHRVKDIARRQGQNGINISFIIYYYFIILVFVCNARD